MEGGAGRREAENLQNETFAVEKYSVRYTVSRYLDSSS